MAVATGVSGKLNNLFQETGKLFALGLESVRLLPRRPFPAGELIDQCWFLAKVTTLPVILVSIPFGIVIALEIGGLIQQVGAGSQLGAVMVLAVVREQAPIATALLIAGAGGSAITADLGSRRIRDEISALEVMAVNPVQRLIVPRLLAATLVAVLLLSITTVSGIGGGLFFGIYVEHIDVASFFSSFNVLSQLADLFLSVFKAAVFGFLAALVACYKGFYCKGGSKGVGDAVNQAVVVTFILLFFVNFILTIVYFNFVPQKAL